MKNLTAKRMCFDVCRPNVQEDVREVRNPDPPAGAVSRCYNSLLSSFLTLTAV